MIEKSKIISRLRSRQAKQRSTLRQGSGQAGFTFIELIVVFSIIAFLSTIGLAAFIHYSRTQTLNTSAADLAAILNSAKAKAQSQAIQDENGENACRNNGSLVGFKVSICLLGDEKQPSGVLCNSKDDYELNILCSDNSEKLVESKKLPDQVIFDISSSTYFIFKSLIGGTDKNKEGKVIISGFGGISKSFYGGGVKEITVNNAGNITVEQSLENEE